jgi:two-component system alkaline phosphatase synthesis response regulator PhoP
MKRLLRDQKSLRFHPSPAETCEKSRRTGVLEAPTCRTQQAIVYCKQWSRRMFSSYHWGEDMASRILFVGKTDSRLQKTWASFEAKGQKVTVVRSRQPALEAVEVAAPDVVIVDMTVARTGAEKLCRKLKKDNPDTPILLLVDADEIAPKIPHDRTLNRAASHRRLNSADSRLLKENRERVLRVGSLSLHLATNAVSGGNGTVNLCPKEASLLATLMRHPSKVLKHAFLMEAVWETDFVEDLGTMWTHVSSLRKKIEPFGRRRVYIHTIRGIGYRLDVWPPPAPE